MNNSYFSDWKFNYKNKYQIIKILLLSITLIPYLFIPAVPGEPDWMIKIAVPGGSPNYQIDLPGSDITSFQLSAPSPIPPGSLYVDLRVYDCLNACKDHNKCVAWTYVPPKERQEPGTCWLKHSIPKEKSDPCCISGSIGEGNTNRPGGDYTHFDNLMGIAVTPQLCQSICANQAKCKAWTFVKPNTIQGPKGVCWLKDNIPTRVENNCCISGYFRYEKPIR